MSIRNKLSAMAVFAALSAMSRGETKTQLEPIEPKETEEERKRRLAKFEVEKNKANGLKQFFYGENSVWAINQKSADKKARKNNFI